jgi:hypothetical protein
MVALTIDADCRAIEGLPLLLKSKKTMYVVTGSGAILAAIFQCSNARSLLARRSRRGKAACVDSECPLSQQAMTLSAVPSFATRATTAFGSAIMSVSGPKASTHIAEVRVSQIVRFCRPEAPDSVCSMFIEGDHSTAPHVRRMESLGYTVIDVLPSPTGVSSMRSKSYRQATM